MKIVVTGASGYLGTKLCHSLLQQGHTVRAFVLRNCDLSSLPSPSTTECFEIAYGDVTDYRSLLDAFSGCQVIFHAAAIVDLWIPNPSEFFTINVGGLKNVLRAAKETNTIQKIIYTSSIFAVGPTDGYIADETQMHPENFFCSEYERSKVAADKIARQAAADGVPIVVVYPGVIYGPGKLTAGNGVATMLIEWFEGRVPGYVGYKNDRTSFCHIDDVVQGHIAAMTKGRLGERYLLTGENASWMHIYDVAAIITNTNKPRFSIPLWVCWIVGWLSILLYYVTGKLPVVTPPVVHTLRHQWAYSCEKAKVELDYNPRNFQDGLKEVLLWLKKSGLINYQVKNVL